MMLNINKGLHNSRPKIIIITKLNLLKLSEQQVTAISSVEAERGDTWISRDACLFKMTERRLRFGITKKFIPMRVLKH